MKKIIIFALTLMACDIQKNSDEVQHEQQERILKEGTSQVGMPAIKNFRERKLLKEILEMRDQASLSTWTYTYSEMTGKRVFLCHSIGFPIPYATQFSNPQQKDFGPVVLPQADPNGLFSPASAEGTWVLCKNPHGTEVKPVYVEPRVMTSTFPLDEEDVVPSDKATTDKIKK